MRLLTIKCRKRHNPLKEDTDLNTYMAKASDVQRKWYIVDAEGVVLGRLASQVASILRGKNKPTYTPHVDTGDYVIVINADKVILTGKKLDQKIYYKHSGFPGGLSETPYRRLLNEKPEFVIQHAVIGMLPKGPLGRQDGQEDEGLQPARSMSMPLSSPKRWSLSKDAEGAKQNGES